MNYLLKNAGNQGSQYGNSTYGNDYQNSSQYTPLRRQNVDQHPAYADSMRYNNNQNNQIKSSATESLLRSFL